MTNRTNKSRALPGLVVLAFAALTALAPVASAQVSTGVPDLSDPVGTVTDTVDTTTGGGTQPVQDSVDTTTGGATQPVQDATQPVQDTVTDTSGDTIGETQKTVDNTTQGAGQTATDTTDTVTGTASGGGVTNPDLTVKNPLEPKDLDGDGTISQKERNLQNNTTQKSGRRAAYRGERPGERADRNALARAKRSALFNLEKKSRLAAANRSPVAIAPPQRETFLTQLTQAAVEATKKLAFPLGLALMVGAFLMVQGRIDRKDAKLALAPIDSEQDLLSFQ